MANIKGWTLDDVGAKVSTEEFGEGVIVFVGKHADNDKPRLGIELPGPTGKHNGTVKGSVYFKCAKKHGVLVVPGKVTRAGSGPAAQPADGGAAAPDPSSWQRKLSRDEAEAHVRAIGKAGAFVARPSPRSPAGWAITLLSDGGGVVHLSVAKDDAGLLRFNASKIGQPSLEALVHFNTKSSQADTPVPLIYSGEAAAPPQQSARSSGKGKKSGKGSSKRRKDKPLDGSSIKVEVTKLEGEGLGMTIANSGQGNVVTKVKPGSVAEAAGIKPGSRIRKVDATDVYASPKADCIAAIKASPSKVVFTLEPGAQPPPKPAFDGVAGNDTAGYVQQSPPPATAAAASPAGDGADQFDGMKRLQLIKYLRDAGLDYRSANDHDDLKAMARAHAAQAGPPAPEGPPAAAAPAQAAAAPTTDGGDEFAAMKRLQLIKLLREKNVDYHSAKNVEELRELARGTASG